MKNTLLNIVILFAGLTFTTFSVQAMELEHKDVDLNLDGKVTESEILAVIKMHFLKMDTNSDSDVSLDEWEVDH